MQVPNRFYNGSDYRYGFNGKEKDDEIKGGGLQYDYGFRIYDPRIGKFLSTDPLAKSYPWYTPYQFAGNMPIVAIDLDGLEEYIPIPSAKKTKPVLRNDETIPCVECHHKDVLSWAPTDQDIETLQTAAIVPAVALDIFVTKGWASRTLMGGLLLESINESERGYEARARGNMAEYERRMQNSAEASKLALYDGAAVIVGFGAKSLGYLSKAAGKINLSFGKNVNLKAFSQQLNSIDFFNFDKIVGYSDASKNFENFEEAFNYVTDAAIKSKGKINFNLEYVNVKQALKIKKGTGLYDKLPELGNKSLWESNMITEWELSKILNDKTLLKSTDFYKMGTKVPTSSIK